MNKPTPLKVSAPVRRCPKTSLDKSREEESRKEREGPSLSLARELFTILDGGVASCSDNPQGIPWRRPRIETLGRLAGEYDADLCVAAAREAREIVQSQDRAPNITGLFEKKLRELAEVRSTVREALA